MLEQILIGQEVQNAFNDFAARGIMKIGCGGAIEITQGVDGILKANSEDVFDGIFGKEKEESDQFGPLVFKCTQGHRNKRKRGELLTECQIKPCKKR